MQDLLPIYIVAISSYLNSVLSQYISRQVSQSQFVLIAIDKFDFQLIFVVCISVLR